MSSTSAAILLWSAAACALSAATHQHQLGGTPRQPRPDVRGRSEGCPAGAGRPRQPGRVAAGLPAVRLFSLRSARLESTPGRGARDRRRRHWPGAGRDRRRDRFPPELDLTRELRLALDPGTKSPTALAPLIDPDVHSCGTVYPHGAEALKHPQPGYYTVGMKSYGRALTFVLLTGYEQVRSVVAALGDNWDAAGKGEAGDAQNGRVFDRPGPRRGPSCCGTSVAESTPLTLAKQALLLPSAGPLGRGPGAYKRGPRVSRCRGCPRYHRATSWGVPYYAFSISLAPMRRTLAGRVARRRRPSRAGCGRPHRAPV
jgi:hypothetical protein